MTLPTTIRFKKLHPDAQLPAHGRPGDAGFDIMAIEDTWIPSGKTVAVSTGIALASCENYQVGADVFMKIEGRSGLALKGIFPVGGIIDATYRGECKVILHNSWNHTYEIKKGDKIAQMVVYRNSSSDAHLIIEEAEEVSESVRGDAGFGSSGR